MADYEVFKSHLKGSVHIPPSKSHSLRALLFAGLASGKSKIINCLDSPDIEAMIQGLEGFGCEIEKDQEEIRVKGIQGAIQSPKDVVDCGNSGIVLRFLSSIAALGSDYTVFSGDYSIRHNRPMNPLISALNNAGAFACSTKSVTLLKAGTAFVIFFSA